MASNKRVMRVMSIVLFTVFSVGAVFSVGVVTVMADDLNEQANEQAQEEKVAEKLVSLLGATEQPVVIGEAKPYTLGKEDVLRIIVRNQPEFSGQFVIGPDGRIQYNFVGDIEAAGLTKEQLKQRLIKELERFVKVPELSVAITAYNSKNVYILGEVARPGKYAMKGDVISLREAVVAAGLPTREAATKRVHIIKFNSEEPACRKVNLYAILYKGKLEDNVDLVSNDIVVVPSTIPSKINRALSTFLSPVTKGAAASALFN